MLLWADELGLKAFAGNHEFMNSQYEINVKHSAALDAADRAFMLKAAVKEIAALEGLVATFMGRPFSDQGGSGFHLHLSLADADGRNAFASDDAAVSPLALRFIGGVIEHAQGLQALLGPTVNAYKRILPDSLAPTHANWGHDNRTAFCRVPERARVAHARRDPHGRRLRLPAPDHRGAPARRARRHRARARAARPRRGRRVPAWTTPTPARSCPPTSVPRSTRSRPTRGSSSSSGSELVSTFVAMKRFEVERFTEAVGELDLEVVSEWEVEEYASHL